MPITLACPACQHQFVPEESLAGSAVHCPNCKAQVKPPDTFTIAEEPAATTSAGGLEELPPPPGEACPLCGTTVPPDATLCPACSFDCRTVMPPEKEIPADPTYVTRKYRRPWGERIRDAFSSLDSLVSTVAFFAVACGLIVWIQHIAQQPGGFYFANLTPAFFAVAATFLFLTPITTLALRIAFAVLKRPEPEDLYRRAATVLALPLALDLFSTGQPPFQNLDTLLVIPAWLLALVLFAYLFRGGAQKLLGSLLAFMLALVIGWSLLNSAATTFPALSALLYKDMMPPGIFLALANGHSPPPVPPSRTSAVATGTPPTTLPPIAENLAHQIAIESSPLEGGDDSASAAPPTPIAAPPVTTPHSPPPVIPSPPHPTTHKNPGAAPAKNNSAAANPEILAAQIISDPELQNIRDLVVNAAPSSHFLAVKSNNGDSTVQRWSVDPLRKENENHFSELPGEPNDYALNVTGTILISLLRFPQNQIQTTSFDNKIFGRKFALDNKDFGGTPSLVGFIDPTRFIVRWTSGILQIWRIDGTLESQTHSHALGRNQSEWTINPNPARGGAGLAVVIAEPGQSQIVLCRTEGWKLVRKITPMNRPFETAGLTYSPDASAIALCSSTLDGASILAFDANTGDGTFTVTFPNDLLTANPHMVNHHGLLWLQNNQAFLVNGTELFEFPTGKHLGSLEMQNIVDAYNVGPGSVLFLQEENAGERRAFVARIDLSALKAEALEKR